MRAQQMELGTTIRIPSQGLVLRLEHGRKPWRVQGGRPGRFSHAEVDGSFEAGDAEVIVYVADDVAAV